MSVIMEKYKNLVRMMLVGILILMDAVFGQGIDPACIRYSKSIGESVGIPFTDVDILLIEGD